MDMLRVLDLEKKSTNVAYHEFLLIYKKGQKLIYGLLEGKTDHSYYRNFIESYVDDPWKCKLIHVGNKKKVLEVYGMIDRQRFELGSVCFFVDQDLEMLLGDGISGDGLYVSDQYSIENDLVNFHLFERILTEICDVGPLTAVELKKLEEIFQKNLETFNESLVCIMAQILIWRRNEMASPGQKCILDKIKPMELFYFQDQKLTLKCEFEDPLKRVEWAANLVGVAMAHHEELALAEAEFRGVGGLQKLIRGKYVFKFLIDISENMRLMLPEIFSRFSSVPGKGFGFGVQTGMTIIGPRGKCPRSLREFISENYVKYMERKEIVIPG